MMLVLFGWVVVSYISLVILQLMVFLWWLVLWKVMDFMVDVQDVVEIILFIRSFVFVVDYFMIVYLVLMGCVCNDVDFEEFVV